MSTKFVQARRALLQSAISDSATSMTVTEFVDLNGDPIVAADIGTVGHGTLAPNTAKEEAISFTIDSNTAGTAVLTITRGLLGKQPYGTGGPSYAHNAGTEFILSNNPDLFNKLTAKDNDETVTGAWKFPATPTHDQHPATKVYVDDEITAVNDTITTLDSAVVKKTGDQTIAGVKTFSSSPVIPAPTTDLQAATKKYADDIAVAGAPNAGETTKGLVEIATSAEYEAGTDAGGTGAQLVPPVGLLRTELDSLQAQISAPSALNAPQTGNLIYYSSDKIGTITVSGYIIKAYIEGFDPITIDPRAHVAAIDAVSSCAVIGSYLYYLAYDTGTTPDTWYVVRVALSGGTQATMTFSGSNQLTTMDGGDMRITSDGTDIYISHLAGNSSNSYDVGRYSISGTTLTYEDTTSLGTDDLYSFVRLTDGTWITHSYANTYTDMNVFASNGTLTRTISNGFPGPSARIVTIAGTPYLGNTSTNIMSKLSLS